MHEFRHEFFALGSNCAIHLHADRETDALAIMRAGEAEVRRIEQRYSRYRDDSDLSRINRAAAEGGTVKVDGETAGLIDYAFACFDKSDGAFDITSGLLRRAWNFSEPRLPPQHEIDALLPRVGLDKVTWSGGHLGFTRPGMELDFGGIGKEYAADCAADACLERGARHGFVNLAGDIRVIGPQADGLPWRIGIAHPRDPARSIAAVELTNGALATSGDYEKYIEIDGRRYCHILDPRTGWPIEGLSSVTVIGDRCLLAGTLATAAMLKGRSGSSWLRRSGVRYITIDSDGRYEGTEPPLVTL